MLHLHVLVAFGSGAWLALGRRGVAEGEKEITVASNLLKTLSLDGDLLTANALQAQGETIRIILDQGGITAFCVEGQHPLMLRKVAGYFADPANKMT